MKRRALLAACGTSLLAGCLGGNDESATVDGPNEEGNAAPTTTTEPPDATPAPPPTDHTVSPDSFETTTNDGVEVGLIPVENAYQWHSDGEARFVDARGATQFEKSHIAGAVNSPAAMEPEPGPTADWESDATIVTYCGCPHHLSVMRASQLKERGFEDVYAIDEGFWAWHERGFPMAGSDVEDAPASVELSGTLDASLAGEEVWAVHEPTAQREVTRIGTDGSYTMHLHFYGVDADSTISLSAGEWTREARLGALTGGV